MVEGVMRRPHEFAEHIAAVERRVILPRDYLDLCGVNLARDLLEQLVALGVLVGSVGVVGQVAGDDHQLGPPLKPVDSRDGAFECPGAERIGRSIETNVRVAQLDERKGRRRLAVEFGHCARKHFVPGAMCERGEHAVKGAD